MPASDHAPGCPWRDGRTTCTCGLINVAEDPRITDAATGLPPLEQVDPADTILLVAWGASVGVATSPLTNEDIAVRYLSVRGLIRGKANDPHSAEWGQIHLAVPVESALDVAAALAKGTTEDLG